MGKTDIRDADAVAAEHTGVRYRAFDLFEAGADGIAGCSPIWPRCSSRSGVLTAAGDHFDVRRAPAALRTSARPATSARSS